MSYKTQVNSATLVMGPSGSGKSSLLATLARYVMEKYNKVSLLYTCDGGGYPAEVQALIQAGIIWVFRMRTRDPGDLGLSFETCHRAAQGWWPRRINPATGEVEPGVEMVPPVTKQWGMYCPSGHLVKSVPSQSLLTPAVCPTCKTMTTKINMGVVERLYPTPGFERVGARLYDGLTSMLAWELQELGHRAGRLELKGEESAIGGKVVSGDLHFGGSTRSHVGFVQARGEQLVHLALSIPNMVVPPVFTALTMEASDDKDLLIVGPKISGRAKTDEAPQWVGNCLEAMKIPAVVGSGEQFALQLAEFTDNQGRRHLCKHRGSPGTMPERLVDPVEGQGQPFTEFNLGKFFELLNAALDRRVSEVLAEFPDAPGLPDGLMEFGGAPTTDQAVETRVVRAAGAAEEAQPSASASPEAAAQTATQPAAVPATTPGPRPAPRPRGRGRAPVQRGAQPETAPAAQPETAPAADLAPTLPLEDQAGQEASQADPQGPEASQAAAQAAQPPQEAPQAPQAAKPPIPPPPGMRPGGRAPMPPPRPPARPVGVAARPPAAAPRPPAVRPATPTPPPAATAGKEAGTP